MRRFFNKTVALVVLAFFLLVLFGVCLGAALVAKAI